MLVYFLLLLIPHTASTIECYSCSIYETSTTDFSMVDLQDYVVDINTYDVVNSVLNTSCSAGGTAECPGLSDRCLSSRSTLTINDDKVGEVLLYVCGNSWMKDNFCNKVTDGFSDGMQTSCSQTGSGCMVDKCNIPPSLLPTTLIPEDSDSDSVDEPAPDVTEGESPESKDSNEEADTDSEVSDPDTKTDSDGDSEDSVPETDTDSEEPTPDAVEQDTNTEEDAAEPPGKDIPDNDVDTAVSDPTTKQDDDSTNIKDEEYKGEEDNEVEEEEYLEEDPAEDDDVPSSSTSLLRASALLLIFIICFTF